MGNLLNSASKSDNGATHQRNNVAQDICIDGDGMIIPADRVKFYMSVNRPFPEIDAFMETYSHISPEDIMRTHAKDILDAARPILEKMAAKTASKNAQAITQACAQAVTQACTHASANTGTTTLVANDTDAKHSKNQTTTMPKDESASENKVVESQQVFNKDVENQVQNDILSHGKRRVSDPLNNARRLNRTSKVIAQEDMDEEDDITPHTQTVPPSRRTTTPSVLAEQPKGESKYDAIVSAYGPENWSKFERQYDECKKVVEKQRLFSKQLPLYWTEAERKDWLRQVSARQAEYEKLCQEMATWIDLHQSEFDERRATLHYLKQEHLIDTAFEKSLIKKINHLESRLTKLRHASISMQP